MGAILEAVANFIFPPRCPACQAYVETRGGWCPECLALTLRPHRLPLSPEMLTQLDGAWALGSYHGALRELIRHLKYQKQRAVLPAIQTFLAASTPWLERELGAGGVAVPVPLFAAKEKQRGFNQSELIFADWLAASGWEWQCALVRTRATQPQYGLDAAARAKNMQGAFAAAPAAVLQGRAVLLVDDILTTGSTLFAGAQALRAAGASSVRALVLASDRI